MLKVQWFDTRSKMPLQPQLSVGKRIPAGRDNRRGTK